MNHPISPQQLLTAISEVVRNHPNKKLAVYVHIPFCSSKCHFCDWVTDIPVRRLRSGPEGRASYVDALCDQIRFYGPQLTRFGYRPKVMYWGGGTPTRLAPEEMRAIRAALDDSFDFSDLVQWTVETTPNDLDAEKLAAMREIGVDRVSVGVQSLNPYQLRKAGRAHSREQALAAFPLLRQAGITNFNVDLISSFPGEDQESFRRTVEDILALDPPHVSVYPYRATPKTVMAMQLDREFLEAHQQHDMVATYEMAMEMLGQAGYHEYCHGYWVRDAAHEDHDGNFKYDLEGDKIGFGSGAESIIGHHLLWSENTKYEEYLDDPRTFSMAHRFTLDDPERLTAPVGGALMTREGVDFARFHRLTGVSFADLRATPYFTRWFQVLEECGARFLESDTNFRMDPTVIHKAYITHLAHSTANGLAPQRA
ncbi:coproporphyrinogen-III oxidase family protein [Streptoalloteichus hindustanus]|uniref:Heme chaperone HemW n=1 Tax=Streptoalloteichus hindustanus TaxID=2017 RepID=A4KUC6_STRHI|nr:coproporphyrinogen-III oxidase family protein [Streptoalloteichus hindustanus]ABL74954.1 Tlm Orf11 [Streptoalloteichus hindustanus]SHF86245.1 oxygen-independent coproporphyrinogen-3 oxidase [Streptoalloteichus hindustanus]